MNRSTETTARTPHRYIPAGIMLIAAILFLSGCTATTAHRHHEYDPGPSVTIEYQYFPDEDVYYDVHRHLYLYHHARRGWLTVTNLPDYIHIDRQHHHVIHSRQRQPWNDHHAYKQHHSHDDGQRPNRRDERREKHDEKPQQGHNSRYVQPPEHKVRDGKTTQPHPVLKNVRHGRQQQVQKRKARRDVSREHDQDVQEDSHMLRSKIRENDHTRVNEKERKLQKVSQHGPEQQRQHKPARYDYQGSKRYD